MAQKKEPNFSLRRPTSTRDAMRGELLRSQTCTRTQRRFLEAWLRRVWTKRQKGSDKDEMQRTWAGSRCVHSFLEVSVNSSSKQLLTGFTCSLDTEIVAVMR